MEADRQVGTNGRNLVEEMIGAAVLAGAYATVARSHPEAAKGLEKLRAAWSIKAATLADEFLEDAGFVLASSFVQTRER